MIFKCQSIAFSLCSISSNCSCGRRIRRKRSMLFGIDDILCQSQCHAVCLNGIFYLKQQWKWLYNTYKWLRGPSQYSLWRRAMQKWKKPPEMAKNQSFHFHWRVKEKNVNNFVGILIQYISIFIISRCLWNVVSMLLANFFLLYPYRTELCLPKTSGKNAENALLMLFHVAGVVVVTFSNFFSSVFTSDLFRRE